MSIVKIESQLPHFQGFYESTLSPESDLAHDLESGMSEEDLAEYYPEQYLAYRSARIVDSHYDEFEIYLRDHGKHDTFSGLSYKEACDKIAEYCVKEFFEDYLNDYGREALGVKSWKFIKVDSPKFYNFSTDECIYELEFDLDIFKTTLNKLISENKEKFQGILNNRHKSRDGFVSSYSNKLEDWLTFESKNVTYDRDHSIDNIMLETYLIFYTEIEMDNEATDNLYIYASHEALC